MNSRIRPRFAALAIGLALLGGACGDNSTEPPLLANGSMSATIDGAAWTASTGLAATYTGGILAVAGTDGQQRSIGIGAAVAAPGTFQIGGTNPTNGSLTVGGQGWQAAITLGSGSVTVTSISATGAKGTFQFTAAPLTTTGATGNRVITQGTFDVTF